MSQPLPHTYEIDLRWTSGSEGTAAAAPRPDLTVAPPPQWGGTDAHWSPEHLLLAALASCQMTTFAAVAAKSQFAFSGYAAKVSGTLEKTPAGIVFTSVRLAVALRVPPGERDKGLRLLELAKKHCIVANSLKAETRLEASVQEEGS